MSAPLERHPEYGYRINPDPDGPLGVRRRNLHVPPKLTMALRFGLVTQDTVFTDTSEFQRSAYTDAYPYQFASFRLCDGTYVDHRAAENLAWCKAAVASGRLAGFIGYAVWRPNWQETVATVKLILGAHAPARMALMWDVEGWGGDISGNQSAGINAAREESIDYFGGVRSRVIGYGNSGDLTSLWPTRGDAHIILANYSSNPAFPGKIAHQYTSTGGVAPFGSPVDVNSADGKTPAQFADVLGLTSHPAPTPVPPTPTGDADMATVFRKIGPDGKPIQSLHLIDTGTYVMILTGGSYSGRGAPVVDLREADYFELRSKAINGVSKTEETKLLAAHAEEHSP